MKLLLFPAGKLRLVNEGGMVPALLDTKNGLDYVQGVEESLATQPQPGETRESLHKTIEDNKV